MKAKLLLISFLLLSAGSIFSQKILVLDLAGMKSKRIRYNSGDYIAIKVINDKTIFKGFLDVMSDSSFLVNGNFVLLDSVTTIIKYNRAPKAISTQAFLVAGVTAIIVGIDNGINKGSLFPSDQSYIIPASFAGIGAILLPFWKKKYRIDGDKRSLKILDLTLIAPVDDSP
jgi:hypothetical protein